MAKAERSREQIQADRIAEQKLVDQLNPELRSLVYEYGLNVIIMAVAITSSRDPERIEKFAEANRRKAQKLLEEECTDSGSKPLQPRSIMGRL